MKTLHDGIAAMESKRAIDRRECSGASSAIRRGVEGALLAALLIAAVTAVMLERVAEHEIDRRARPAADVGGT